MRLGYFASLDWILECDDTDWLDEEDPFSIPSVTACLVADMFGKEIDEVVRALLRRRKKK